MPAMCFVNNTSLQALWTWRFACFYTIIMLSPGRSLRSFCRLCVARNQIVSRIVLKCRCPEKLSTIWWEDACTVLYLCCPEDWPMTGFTIRITVGLVVNMLKLRRKLWKFLWRKCNVLISGRTLCQYEIIIAPWFWPTSRGCSIWIWSHRWFLQWCEEWCHHHLLQKRCSTVAEAKFPTESSYSKDPQHSVFSSAPSIFMELVTHTIAPEGKSSHIKQESRVWSRH